MLTSRTLPPRVVVVTRPTDLEGLLLRHATKEQARFVVEHRGGSFADIEARHEVSASAVHAVQAVVPRAWRRARIGREDLDRFLFEPEDVVVAVGQDGLVANVAKYLSGQPVIGVNPSRALFDGLLVRHPPEAVADLLAGAAAGRVGIEERSMLARCLAQDGASFQQLARDVLPRADLLRQLQPPRSEPVHPALDGVFIPADPGNGERRGPAIVAQRRHG